MMTPEDMLAIQDHYKICIHCNADAKPADVCVFCGKPALLKTLVKVCPACVKGAVDVFAQEVK